MFSKSLSYLMSVCPLCGNTVRLNSCSVDKHGWRVAVGHQVYGMLYTV